MTYYDDGFDYGDDDNDDDGCGDCSCCRSSSALNAAYTIQGRMKAKADAKGGTGAMECTCNVSDGFRCDRHPRKAMRLRQMTQGGFWDA